MDRHTMCVVAQSAQPTIDSSRPTERRMIRLTVSRGPDAGTSAELTSASISFGRGVDNAFRLTDAHMCDRHGVLARDGSGQWVYRDERTRHGTLVRQQGSVATLHDRHAARMVALNGPCELVVGESVISVEMRDAAGAWLRWAAPSASAAVRGERIELSPSHTVTETDAQFQMVTQRITRRDPRLMSIFRVSRDLNALRRADDVITCITDAVFEAFAHATSLRLISASERDAQRPDLIRTRGGHASLGVPDEVESDVMVDGQVAMGTWTPSSDAAAAVALASPPPTVAYMAAPMVGSRGVIGAIFVHCTVVERGFGANDLDVLTVLASYAAFALERVRLQDDIYDMFQGIVRMSVGAIEARDASTAGHSERVADYAVRLAHAWNARAAEAERLEAWEITELYYASLLHDFGKVGVREAMLTKARRLSPDRLLAVRERIRAVRAELRLAGANPDVERFLHDAETVVVSCQPGRRLSTTARDLLTALGPDGEGRPEGVPALLDADELAQMLVPKGTLTPDELAHVQSHAELSASFLSQIPWSPELARIPNFALAHHERLDGSGYPKGLKAREIPLQVRILSIADVFDAVTAVDRPYREGGSLDSAIHILEQEAECGLLDSALVGCFVDAVVPTVDPAHPRTTRLIHLPNQTSR